VILGNRTRGTATSESPFRGMTLDDMFHRAAGRHGDALALIDPPDRASFTDGTPKRLTYAEADRIVTAIAARLTSLGLRADAIVALQLPNTVESVLSLLGVLRAGMIAAPLPLLWRQMDAPRALGRIGARALITSRRIGPVDHGELAMHIAADTFTIRFLCAFGQKDLDGVVAFDDLFDPPYGAAPEIVVEREGDPADHVAVVTFDTSPEGLVPVARTHGELVAGGLAVALEAKIARDSSLLGALAISSFAGLATTVMPWLLGGGTLSLHQPFDAATFAVQCGSYHCDTAILPGPLVGRLAEAGQIGGRDGPKSILSIWRAPERLSGSAEWGSSEAGLVDVLAFGETGVIALRRAAGGKPGAIRPGPLTAGRNHGEGLVLLDVVRSATGTLALGGAMIPHHPFPPGVERSGAPRLKIDDGLIDTGYPCRTERATGNLLLDGPPAGLVTVGGYRFLLKELQDFVAQVADGSTLAALPDGLSGHRLAGVAADRATVRRLLAEQGVNPLIVGAFRERRGDQASAA
jgi:AMP-binding enzyme